MRQLLILAARNGHSLGILAAGHRLLVMLRRFAGVGGGACGDGGGGGRLPVVIDQGGWNVHLWTVHTLSTAVAVNVCRNVD